MQPKSADRTPSFFSMLVLPWSILLSATALSSLTILTLAAGYLGKPMVASGPKIARRVRHTVATRKGWQLIVMTPKG